MFWGLPANVLESIEIFTLKYSSSHFLWHFNFPFSASPFPMVDSKSGGLVSLRGSSQSLYGEKVGTANLASILDHPLPPRMWARKDRWP